MYFIYLVDECAKLHIFVELPEHVGQKHASVKDY